jgi:hypothetical protein
VCLPRGGQLHARVPRVPGPATDKHVHITTRCQPRFRAERTGTEAETAMKDLTPEECEAALAGRAKAAPPPKERYIPGSLPRPGMPK